MSDKYVATTGNDTTGDGSSGNPYLTVSKGLSMIGSGDTLWVKGGTYQISTGLTASGASYTALRRICGYTTTPGDGGFATIQATANVTMLAVTTDGWDIQNLVIDGNATATLLLTVAGTYGGVNFDNCDFKNAASASVNINLTVANTGFFRCRFRGNTATSYVLDGSTVKLVGCAFHNNVGTAARVAANSQVIRSIFANNTGASADGLTTTDPCYPLIINTCTFYGNGRDGLRLITYYHIGRSLFGCAFVSNGAYGVTEATGNGQRTAWPTPAYNFNAFYGNATAARNGVVAGANDVTLTAAPFVDPTGTSGAATLADVFACFRPNSVPGGGLALRGASVPSNLDIGAGQHTEFSPRIGFSLGV